MMGARIIRGEQDSYRLLGDEPVHHGSRIVWKAEAEAGPGPCTLVAVKQSAYATYDRSIAQEADVLSRLVGIEGLPRFRELIFSEPRATLILDWVGTETLRTHWQGVPGPDRWGERVSPLFSLAATLAHVHARNIAHCDLTPEHLLGNDGAWYLIDFSHGREGGRPVAVGGWGTKPYWVPEATQQVLPSGTARACDAFQFGTMLYEALTGRLPFVLPPGTNDSGSLPKGFWATPVPLDCIPFDVPDELVTLTNRLLQLNPGSRPEFTTALADELRRASEAEHRPCLPGTIMGRRAEAGSSLSLPVLIPPGSRVEAAGSPFVLARVEDGSLYLDIDPSAPEGTIEVELRLSRGGREVERRSFPLQIESSKPRRRFRFWR